MIRLEDLRRAITPLRLVFWGVLLAVFDITIQSGEHELDLLPDVVGVVLILIGVLRLTGIPVGGSYGGWMTFVSAVTVLSLLDVIVGWFAKPGPGVEIFQTIVDSLELVGAVGFMVAMHGLCREAGLDRPARSWRTTMLLVVCFLVGPLGVLRLVDVLLRMTGEEALLGVGLLAFLTMLLAVFPLVHFFISVSRTAREAEDRGYGDEEE